MAPVMKPSKPREHDDLAFKSNNLWVGSLSTDTTESDLVELFGRFGEIDRITAYSTRSFAFIYYRRVEEAVAAKEALHGTNLNGSQIKIEYARPAKPCKSLWVGGISPAVSKDELEAEFRKYGEFEDFRFLRERRTAFIDYFELEDAVAAAKSMNGKRIGGSYLRVDFLRSQGPRKEQWSGSYDTRDGHFPGRDGNPNAKQLYSHSFGDGKGDGQPSNVLWIGYPPSVQIDEQMLHNAMILFGEIERIKSFPSRHFSLVEFRSAEEARRAKEGLQGRLFNDPRITITYSNSDLPPGQDDTGFYSGVKRSRPDIFVNDPPFVSSPTDTYGRGNAIMGSGAPHSSGILGPMRPLRGNMERLQAGAEYSDVVGKEASWRRPSPPGAGILPSPAQGMRPTMRQNPGSWEGYDPAQLDRAVKRSRRDGSVDAYPPVGIDDRVLDRSYGPGPVAARPGRGFPSSDFIWRGIIAKGGTPVCHARCVPIGKGIETELPEVVNCSARTGLDMLAKHYAEAIGFDIVFFLPDSEDDFASYTEFLRYLGSKNRAGVAKLDDGTTLFLVPPSDFLTTVLKVSGPERLYGVVLKLPPPPVPVAASGRPESQSVPPSYVDQPRDSPANLSHGLYPAREDQAPPLDYNRGVQEELKSPLAVGGQAGPKAGISLTPELIATLATLLPATSQPSAPETHQPLSGTSTVVSTTPQSIGLSSITPLQAWKQDQQTVTEPTSQSFQQFGNQYNPAAQLPPPPPSRYIPVSSTPSYSSGMMHGGLQFQGPPVSMPQQAPLLSMPMNNYAMYPQNSHYAISQPTTQQYQPEAPVPNQNYGAVPGTETPGLQGYLAYQQANYPSVTTNQAHTANFSQPQASMPSSADKANLELTSQAQQLQPVLPGTGQVAADGEVDKNQRYQSTLQFAANLLLQIQQQQQQQQSDAPTGPGT